MTAVVDPSAPQWMLGATIVLCNTGVGLSTPAIVVGTIQEAGPNNANIGSAMLNANRQLGSLAGVAAMGILLQIIDEWTTSVRLAFVCFAVCMGSAWVMAIWLSRNKPDELLDQSTEVSVAVVLVD